MTSFSLVDQDFFNAASNWLRWKDVYESSHIEPLPILSSKERFQSFCSEYSVLRYELPKPKESLREGLSSDLDAFTENTSVEQVAAGWIKRHGLKKTHVSFATKVLAFRDAVHFVPMDRFSKVGLVRVDSGAKVSDYASYRQRFFAAKQKYDTEISALREKYKNFKVSNAAAFENRILDCALMRIGGR